MNFRIYKPIEDDLKTKLKNEIDEKLNNCRLLNNKEIKMLILGDYSAEIIMKIKNVYIDEYSEIKHNIVSSNLLEFIFIKKEIQ